MEWECGDTAVVCVCGADRLWNGNVETLQLCVCGADRLWNGNVETLQLCVCGADRLWNVNVGDAAVVCVFMCGYYSQE